MLQGVKILVFVAIAYDLATFKEAIGSHMVTDVSFTCHWILRQGSAS
jgi:hypothetical protein